MIRIASETELLGSFREMDRNEVVLPEGLRFPLLIKDYLAWTDPSGCKVWVVFDDRARKQPLGIGFRRDQAGGGASTGMCEWCHSVRGGDGIGLLTASASAKRRVGIYLCRDLSCKEKIEGVPGVDDVPQSLNRQERLRQIVQRMSTFARQNLF